MTGPGAGGLRSEVSRLTRTPTTFLAAAAAALCVWALLPATARSWVGDTVLAGAVPPPLVVVVVVQAALLAGGHACNPLGLDPATALSAVKRRTVTALLRQKGTAVGLVIATISLVALGVAMAVNGTDGAGLAPVLVAQAFGVPAAAGLLGVVLPTKPRPLRWRLQHLSDPRLTARWVFARGLLPFPLVAAGLAALHRSAALAARWLAPIGPVGEGAMRSAVACLLCLVVFLLGPVLLGGLVDRHPLGVMAYLTDPDVA